MSTGSEIKGLVDLAGPSALLEFFQISSVSGVMGMLNLKFLLRIWFPVIKTMRVVEVECF